MIICTRRCLFPLAVVLLMLWGNAGAESLPPLTLGIHPYLPANELIARFQPLADYLGKATGRPINIRIGRDYDEHINAAGTNKMDIAFIGPAEYVKLVGEYGPRPLLARLEVNGKPELFGAIIVRKDSSIRNLADLKGHSFAFGDPNSTMSHIVPYGMMREAGVPMSALSEYKFLGAHKNVALGVLSGDYDAGAVKMEVFDEFAARGLRLLTKTPPVSEHLLFVRPDMPAGLIRKLRQALFKLKSLPEGTRIMHSFRNDMTAFVPVDDKDYSNLRTFMRGIAPAK